MADFVRFSDPLPRRKRCPVRAQPSDFRQIEHLGQHAQRPVGLMCNRISDLWNAEKI